VRVRTFALKKRTHEAMRLYKHNKIFRRRHRPRGARSVWPRNYYCAVARGHLGRRSSATGTVARPWADWSAAILAAVPSSWVEHGMGFFRPGQFWSREIR
jgi:hypothetical protein